MPGGYSSLASNKGAGSGDRRRAESGRRFARMEAGEPCYLETLKARNVPCYKRNGFCVVTEGDSSDSAVHAWSMRRD
jgi:hypothetical protein